MMLKQEATNHAVDAVHRKEPRKMTTTIYFIRHGQTDLNRKRVLQGRVDQPLNEEGIAQAKEAGEYLRAKGVTFDRILSSPLKRAKDTAQIIAGENVPLQTDERLLEMDYGPYEGADLKTPPPEIVKFFSDFAHVPAPDGMEPLNHVVQRLGLFLEDLREEIAGRDEALEETILISTHAIAMKGALEYLTPQSHGTYWGTHIRNCELYVTHLEDGEFTVPVPVE